MSSNEAQIWLEQWRSMPKEAHSKAADEQQRWSLPDWLYWMEPQQSGWRWAGATEQAPGELEVTLWVEGWPVALGAFKWLAKAAGVVGMRVVAP
jgi:hypothetical protein